MSRITLNNTSLYTEFEHEVKTLTRPSTDPNNQRNVTTYICTPKFISFLTSALSGKLPTSYSDRCTLIDAIGTETPAAMLQSINERCSSNSGTYLRYFIDATATGIQLFFDARPKNATSLKPKADEPKPELIRSECKDQHLINIVNNYLSLMCPLYVATYHRHIVGLATDPKNEVGNLDNVITPFRSCLNYCLLANPIVPVSILGTLDVLGLLLPSISLNGLADLSFMAPTSLAMNTFNQIKDFPNAIALSFPTHLPSTKTACLSLQFTMLRVKGQLSIIMRNKPDSVKFSQFFNNDRAMKLVSVIEAGEFSLDFNTDSIPTIMAQTLPQTATRTQHESDDEQI